ncbi:MAG TPA: hypothetical protein VFY01_05300 [Rheinheimera sp.]|nr:hypothetical protein [Rheinheimera sp.]
MTEHSNKYWKAVGLCALLATVFILIGFDSILSFLRASSQYDQMLQSNRELIILGYSHGFLPGVALITFTLALIFVLLLTLKVIPKRNTPLPKRINTIISYSAVIGVITVFAGNFTINHLLDKQAAERGYQACPIGTVLTNRLTYIAWVRNEALCYDADVQQLVIRGTPEESLQVEQLIAARKKQHEAKRSFLEQETKLKQHSRNTDG